MRYQVGAMVGDEVLEAGVKLLLPEYAGQQVVLR